MWYDAIIFALLVICVIRGAAKGFLWQVATIGALLLCFFFAESASLAIAPLIKLDPPLNRWIAMFALYIGASFVSFALARTVRSALEKHKFEEYDKHLGAIFGFVKGVAIALVITFFAVTLSESLRAQVLQSYSGYSAGKILSALHPVMPEEFCGIIDPYLEKLGQQVSHDHNHDEHGHDHDGHSHDGGFDDGLFDDGHDHAHDDFGRSPEGSVPDGTWMSGPDTPATADDFGDPPPSFGPSPDWPEGTRPTTHEPATREPAPMQASQTAPNAMDDLRRLVDDVPDDLKDTALRALQNTKPEDREELISKFQSAVPGLIDAVSHEWANGKPSETDMTRLAESTLNEIAAIYNGRDTEAQRQIIRRAEEQMRGVPNAVANAVLQDWHADLQRSGNDPDPTTNLSTRLDERIRRQLAAHGISPDRLSADLRARLGL